MCNIAQDPTRSKEEIRSDFLDDAPPESPFQVYEAIALDVVKEKCPHLMQLFDDRVFEMIDEAIVLGIHAALYAAGIEDSWQPLYRRTLNAMDK